MSRGADAADLAVLLVRPRASGGLAAHVDREREALRTAGAVVREAEVDIRERPEPLADLRSLRTLRALMRRDLGATVHAHGLRAGALVALAARTLPARRRPRVVVTLHNRTVGPRAVRGIGAALLRILCRGADAVLAVSPDLAEQARGAGAREVHHAIVPAPPEQPHPSRPESREPVSAHEARDGTQPLSVLVLARLAPQKGLEDLLDAVELLPRGTVHVRIAGEGPLRPRLEASIAARALDVELLGWREDVPALLQQTDLVVSAALWEGQPVALQQVLRAGVPIVATDAGGTRWVTGDAAQIVPVADPSALAAAIARHTDQAVRAAAAQASLRRAQQLPTEADMVSQLIEILAPPAPG